MAARHHGEISQFRSSTDAGTTIDAHFDRDVLQLIGDRSDQGKASLPGFLGRRREQQRLARARVAFHEQDLALPFHRARENAENRVVLRRPSSHRARASRISLVSHGVPPDKRPLVPTRPLTEKTSLNDNLGPGAGVNAHDRPI